MINVYEKCPIFESDAYLLRLVQEEDIDDLLEVYSDKNALPFFNSDNCHGDNFYYPTRERMQFAPWILIATFNTVTLIVWIAEILLPPSPAPYSPKRYKPWDCT